MLRRACLLGADEGFDAVEAVVLPEMWFGAEEKGRRHFIEVLLPLIPATGVCERTDGRHTDESATGSERRSGRRRSGRSVCGTVRREWLSVKKLVVYRHCISYWL